MLDVLARRGIATLDITGGAPELNPHFRRLVRGARALGVKVMDRCNLTILSEPGQEDLAEFLAAERVEIVASMPCYLADNVERQRGKGVFDGSIRGLKHLNALGYGRDPALVLNLVYNPQGPSLPPAQVALEADYKRILGETHGIVFNRLFVLANMPIQRFGSMLVSKGEFDGYLRLLQDAHLDANLDGVMCRNLISVDWRGYVYDCDFNQMLDLPLAPRCERTRASLRPARRRPRRQSDPRRRPLLRLHRRPRFELRRRAEGSGRMTRCRSSSPCSTRPPASLRRSKRWRRCGQRGAEVIVVDGGSRDGTPDAGAPARRPRDRGAARPRRADECRRRGGQRRCAAVPARRHAPAGRMPTA